MKKILHLALMCLLMFNIAEAQTRAYIVNEPVTPHSLTTLGLTTNSVATGLDVVAKGTFVYLSAENIDSEVDTVQTATFSFLSVPAGSAATLTPFGSKWAYFQADLTGQYTVKVIITTVSGTDDTTRVITAATYKGVGNFEGVAAQFPQCMSCHAAMPKFTAIFDRWKVSGHANIFKNQVIGGDHYSASCMKCHTTGMDHNVVADNNGFDDVAATLGWSYAPPSSQGQWDSLVTLKPGLVNFGTIGCENCHGAGGEHALGGDKTKIDISLQAGVCASCHDEPWRHNKYAEYENSTHAEAIWESGFIQTPASQNNSLSNCFRCHDGRGYINFTNGVTSNPAGMTVADHTAITCQTCHDPHGNTNVASLRFTPTSSDTLGNGFHYADLGGTGQTCMNCHKARRDNVVYMNNAVSRTWGPHHSVQADNIFGQNAASFGTPFASNGAHKFIENTCVTCHMSESPANGNENRDKVGNHTFKLHNEENGYDHTVACTGCHGPKENFEDAFTAVSDYDGDGSVESVRNEVAGLVTTLRTWLSPVGVDSVDWNLILANNNINEKKAYWNYQLIAYDGSGGMHNSKFAVDVLTKSIIAIGGVVPVQMTTFTAEANGNVVMLNWETSTETNNKGFDIERKINKSFEKIAFVSGNGTTSELKNYTYSDKLNYSGTVTYRIKQIDFDGTVSYSKEVEVELAVPAEYKLSQNYPNPFNPSTKFTYSIPVDSRVKVLIYSISGELVKELVNSNQTAGNYEIEFNTRSVSSLSSGIYFYSVEATAGDGSKTFKETKKMVLLK